MLLERFESVSLALTPAVLLIVPAEEGVTTIVTVAVPSTARLPRLQTTKLVPLQIPCVAVAETNTVPGGGVSVTVTFVAAPGPWLVTTMR